MKRNWTNSATVLLVVLLLLGCSTDKHAETADTYTCPMHPTVVSDRPSTCPVCGMDLVRKARPGEEVKITEDLARLIKSPNEVVTANIATVKAEYKARNTSAEFYGIVTYDTRQIATIPARIGGRLEKVYLKYEYQEVGKGQKVADIYSPDLLTAQREFLYLLESDPGNQELIQAARTKLMLLGASDKQIDGIAANKEPLSTFPIFSSQRGYVVGDNQTAPAAPLSSATGSSAGMVGMGSGTPASSVVSQSVTTQSNQELVRAGRYVSPGETLFRVVNTESLWVELSIPSSAAGAIKKDDKVMLNFGEGNTKEARIGFVQPFFSEGQEFLQVRVYVKGDNLRIGQLVRATINLNIAETLWLPKEAVLDLGTERIAFVKEREVFKPRKVTVGVSADQWIEIKQGLLSSDEVAANAMYLVDSESFTKSKK